MDKFQILKLDIGRMGYINKRFDWHLRHIQPNKFAYAKLNRDRFKYMSWWDKCHGKMN